MQFGWLLSAQSAARWTFSSLVLTGFSRLIGDEMSEFALIKLMLWSSTNVATLSTQSATIC